MTYKNEENEIREITSCQESSEWFEERAKRLTSSNFGTICKRKTKKNKLASMLFAQKRIKCSAIEWRIDHEDEARKSYIARNNIQVRQTGLLVNDKYLYLGCSPDGLVGTKGMIENAPTC